MGRIPGESAGFYEIQTQTGWGRILAAFVEWCQPQPGWVTLDVGCGPGLLPALAARQGCTSFGVDLDPSSFHPAGLHPHLAVAHGAYLPFAAQRFDLATASNLLFLMRDPVQVLVEIRRVLKPGGRVGVLNPSENLTQARAAALADQRGLQGLARHSLLNWARLAEAHMRWSEADLHDLFSRAGLHLLDSTLRVGPGLARLAVAALL